ncbi:MAG: hypothetical protein RLP09_27470, partial [Sandaracinaceae bacterium]
MTAEERHALTRVVRRYAREIDEEAMEDSLAVRLEATQESTVDRFESPRVSTEGPDVPKKLVTLRTVGRPRDPDPSVQRDARSSDEPPDPTSDS